MSVTPTPPHAGGGPPPPEGAQPVDLTPERGLEVFALIKNEILEKNAYDPVLVATDMGIWMSLGSQLIPDDRHKNWLRDAPKGLTIDAVDQLPYRVAYLMLLDELIRYQEAPDGSPWSSASQILFDKGVIEATERGWISPDPEIAEGNLSKQVLGYAKATQEALTAYLDPTSHIKEKPMQTIMVRFGQVVEHVAYDLYLQRREHYHARLVRDRGSAPLAGLAAITAEFVRRRDRELESLVEPN